MNKERPYHTTDEFHTSENIHIRFFIKSRKIDRHLVTSIINACGNLGSTYSVLGGFSTNHNHKYREATLEDAINALSDDEGMLWMDHKGIGEYNIRFHPTAYKSTFGELWITTYGGNLEHEMEGPGNARELIKIAKAVWNALDEKPVYGYGDDERYLPTSAGAHPDDNDVFALNIPINKFWLNFYGKKMIEKFGRKKLEEKAYLVENIDDGILVATDNVPKACKGGWGKTEAQKKAEVVGFMKGVEEYLKKSKKDAI